MCSLTLITFVSILFSHLVQETIRPTKFLMSKSEFSCAWFLCGSMSKFKLINTPASEIMLSITTCLQATHQSVQDPFTYRVYQSHLTPWNLTRYGKNRSAWTVTTQTLSELLQVSTWKYSRRKRKGNASIDGICVNKENVNTIRAPNWKR